MTYLRYAINEIYAINEAYLQCTHLEWLCVLPKKVSFIKLAHQSWCFYAHLTYFSFFICASPHLLKKCNKKYLRQRQAINEILLITYISLMPYLSQ